MTIQSRTTKSLQVSKNLSPPSSRRRLQPLVPLQKTSQTAVTKHPLAAAERDRKLFIVNKVKPKTDMTCGNDDMSPVVS